MAVKYSFPVISASDRLATEIAAEAISIALDHIDVSSDPKNTDVWFESTLTAEEEIILNNVMANHVIVLTPEIEIKNAQKDSDGAMLSRTKITTTGWHYQLHGVEFETSMLNSNTSKKVDGTEHGFSALKFYKLVEGIETQITGDDLNQEYLNANCIKTIMDWEPNHDLEIIGGMLKQRVIPTDDVRLWVVGVPDVPEVAGGSKPFAVNINLAYLDGQGVKVDGRAPKYLTYSPYHTNKIRIILRHNTGFKHKMNMIFELFKA